MMPTTTHKGFKITYSEVMDHWSCSEIGKHSDTLKGVKTMIDAHQRKMRKGVAVDAFEVGGVFRFQNVNQDTKTVTLSPARVVEYLGVSSSRYSGGGVEVAVMPQGGSRRKTNLRNLFKATKENEEIAERAHQKGLEAVSAISQMNLILGEMERLSEHDVAALSRMSETE